MKRQNTDQTQELRQQEKKKIEKEVNMDLTLSFSDKSKILETVMADQNKKRVAIDQGHQIYFQPDQVLANQQNFICNKIYLL